MELKKAIAAGTREETQAQARLGKITTDSKAAETALTKLNAQIDKDSARGDKLKEDNALTSKQLADTDKKLEKLNTDLAAGKATDAEANKQLAELKKAIAASTREETQANARLKKLGTDSKAAETALAKLTAQIDKDSARGDKLGKDNAAAAKKLTDLNTKQKRVTAEITASKQAQQKLEKTIKQLTEKTAGLEKRQHQLTKAESDLAARNTEIQAAEKTKLSLQSDQASLERDLLKATDTLADRQQAVSALDAQLLDLNKKRKEHENLTAKIKELSKECEILGKRRAEIAHAEAKLATLTEDFGEAALRHQGETKARVKTEEKLHLLQADLQNISGEARHLAQLREQLAAAAGELEGNRSKAAAMQAEVDKLEKTSARLRSETNDLEVRAQKYQTVRTETAKLEAQAGELQATQTKLKGVEDRLGEARSEQTQLIAELKRLRERKKTLRKAPDLEWGTVHMLSRTMIRRIDLMDELIIRAQSITNDGEMIEQLALMRSSLIEALAEHGVATFSYSDGSKIDETNRDKIQVVEAGSDGSKDKIITTLKPGFLCRNGDSANPTILRKAEVKA